MQPPSKQCEALVRTLVPFAEKMICEHGDFRPFGGVVDSGGIIHLVGMWERVDRRPSEMIRDLHGTMVRNAGAGEILAAAILYDVRATPPGTKTNMDAIAVDVDHYTGISQTVIYPYRFEGRELRLCKCYAVKNQHPVFRRH